MVKKIIIENLAIKEKSRIFAVLKLIINLRTTFDIAACIKISKIRITIHY